VTGRHCVELEQHAGTCAATATASDATRLSGLRRLQGQAPCRPRRARRRRVVETTGDHARPHASPGDRYAACNAGGCGCHEAAAKCSCVEAKTMAQTTTRTTAQSPAAPASRDACQCTGRPRGSRMLMPMHLCADHAWPSVPDKAS
jgi:hypothetical protein